MKFTRSIFLATLPMASMLITPLSLQAEEQAPIIVTATRTAQTADETLSPVIVIDRSEIESNPGAEVSDLLRMHAGIDISRTGGPGQQTSVFIRGANSAHTLILLDGVSINPDIGNAAIQNISLDMIERIEVVKGPRSTLYGSQAIGGVINIITRRGKEGSHYQAHAGAGSYATNKYGFAAHNTRDNSAAGITVDVSRTAGFPTLKTKTTDRGYKNLSINLYGKKKMGNTDLEITHNHSSGKAEYIDTYSTPQNLDQDYTNNLTTLGINNSPTSSWTSKIKLSHMEDTIKQNQKSDLSQTHRNALDWQNDIQANNNNLITAGLYAAQEHTKSVGYSTFDKNTDHYAAFIQDDMLSGAHHLVAGIRANKYQAFGNHTTHNIEYGYAMNEHLRINLAHNTGYRAPSATDRFGASGNINLLPEESTNNELGVRYKINKQQNVTINHFQNNITNLIEYDSGTSKMKNTGKAELIGTEINYQFTGHSWDISFDAIDQDPRNKINNTRLYRRPKQKYDLAIAHKWEENRVQLDVSHVGQRTDYNASMNAYTLVNLSGKYQFTKQLSLTARVENMTDEDYELAATYRTPGRSYYAEFQYNFD